MGVQVNRTHRLHVRVKEHEHVRFKLAAEIECKRVAEWTRDVLNRAARERIVSSGGGGDS